MKYLVTSISFVLMLISCTNVVAGNNPVVDPTPTFPVSPVEQTVIDFLTSVSAIQGQDKCPYDIDDVDALGIEVPVELTLPEMERIASVGFSDDVLTGSPFDVDSNVPSTKDDMATLFPIIIHTQTEPTTAFAEGHPPRGWSFDPDCGTVPEPDKGELMI